MHRLRTVESFSKGKEGKEGKSSASCAAAAVAAAAVAAAAANHRFSALFFRLVFGEGRRKPEVGDPGFDNDDVCADDYYADKNGAGAGAGESSSMRVNI
jgi:hypothetical protein